MKETTAKQLRTFRLSAEEFQNIAKIASAIGTNRTAALRYAISLALAAQQIEIPRTAKRLDTSYSI